MYSTRMLVFFLFYFISFMAVIIFFQKRFDIFCQSFKYWWIIIFQNLWLFIKYELSFWVSAFRINKITWLLCFYLRRSEHTGAPSSVASNSAKRCRRSSEQPRTRTPKSTSTLNTEQQTCLELAFCISELVMCCAVDPHCLSFSISFSFFHSLRCRIYSFNT